MSFLPIVERELRTRARQKNTYRFRMGGALVAILIATFLLATGQVMSTPGTIGSGIFAALAWLVFLYCLFGGAWNTADCLSEEKRAGTLGLLFLTDLKGYDVVLGKLMATSLNSFYGLLAIFPPLAIPLVLGGVTGGEFWRLALALANTLFFSLAIGMFISAVSRQERRAWGGTMALIIFFALVPPFLRLTPFLSNSALTLASPSIAFIGAFDLRYLANPSEYWGSLFWIHLVSWLFLGAASYFLPRSWQDNPIQPKSFWVRQLPPPLLAIPDTGRRRKRAQRLDRNPIFWLASRKEEQRIYLWAFVIVGGGTALVAWATTAGSIPVAGTIFIGSLALHLGLTVWVASRACFFLGEARRSGALELLLSTPVTVGEIVEGHFLALKRSFLHPVLALASVEMVLLTSQLFVLYAHPFDPYISIMITLGVGLCLLSSLMDLPAAARFGMWMGLTSKKPSHAFHKTLLYVPASTVLLVSCCTVLWPVLGIVKNLILMNYAKDQLRRQFRTIVTERFAFGPESGGWTEPKQRGKAQRPLPSVLPP